MKRKIPFSSLFMIFVIILFLIDYTQNLSSFNYYLGDFILLTLFSVMWFAFSIKHEILENELTTKLSIIVPPVLMYIIVYVLIFYNYSKMIGFGVGMLGVLVTFGSGKESHIKEIKDKYIFVEKENLKEFYKWITLRNDKVEKQDIKELYKKFKQEN